MGEWAGQAEAAILKQTPSQEAAAMHELAQELERVLQGLEWLDSTDQAALLVFECRSWVGTASPRSREAVAGATRTAS
jgi:hypothetical protein